MIAEWVFQIALAEMAVAVLMYIYILIKQGRALRLQGKGRPLRFLVFGAIFMLIVGALPLMYVYANTLWFHDNHIWIIYFAVLANATSKLFAALIMIAIYKYRVLPEG